jgi:Ca2+-binding EF-hand superfamily protein
MVKLVDDDDSGQIEFPEFLRIIKMSGGDSQTSRITEFFKDLS